MTKAKPKADLPEELKPALPELGTTLCPVCKRRVTVFVTKTKRPFINCGYCSARVFYNGRASMRILQREMKPVRRSTTADGAHSPNANRPL
jgi:DNA-directed RNA polymerase subunit RPC12/RpoP